LEGFVACAYLNKLLNLAGLEGFKYDINLIMTIFFGLFLVYAGIKSWSAGDEDDDEDYNNTEGLD
jgi:tellurite resistance protein TerC